MDDTLFTLYYLLTIGTLAIRIRTSLCISTSEQGPGLARTHISTVTDSHELGQLHLIFSPHNGEELLIMERFKGLVHPSHYGEI